jgi:DNA-binding NarL/FixJ family response regulator
MRSYGIIIKVSGTTLEERANLLKVLVVDHHEIWRIGVSKILHEQPGIEVIEPCSNINECLEKAARFDPDVVLLDTELREPSYVEVIQHIRESSSKAKVLMVTHSEREEDVYYAVKAGAKGYVSKKVAIEDLVKAIFLVANGGVVLSPVIATQVLEEFAESFPGRQRTRQRGGLGLTGREKEVLALVAQGTNNRTIASSLCITENTVKVHLRNIMEKLQVHNRLQAAARASEADVLYRKAGDSRI